MPPTGPDPVDFDRLRGIHMMAIISGALIFCFSMFVSGQFSDPELGWIVLCLALAAAGFSGIFYFACLIFVPRLQSYIRGDNTVIRGANVEMVTETETSGNALLDEWVSRYVFARNTFGLSIVPLLLLAGVFIFG